VTQAAISVYECLTICRCRRYVGRSEKFLLGDGERAPCRLGQGAEMTRSTSRVSRVLMFGPLAPFAEEYRRLPGSHRRSQAWDLAVPVLLPLS
jgi:hypothetical protein